MPRGLSLEQFKNELEGDAQIRCEAQEKTIKHLKMLLDKYKEKEIEQNKDMESLMNRCFALSMGSLCLFCGFKDKCKRYQTI